ncbi:hypothetical protein H0H87_010072 [Tephrocybe sp. NHM501043]|nr:hypothetical protein H0H87_010072 [Tephrocybe sp. NHM501043]
MPDITARVLGDYTRDEYTRRSSELLESTIVSPKSMSNPIAHIPQQGSKISPNIMVKPITANPTESRSSRLLAIFSEFMANPVAVEARVPGPSKQPEAVVVPSKRKVQRIVIAPPIQGDPDSASGNVGKRSSMGPNPVVSSLERMSQPETIVARNSGDFIGDVKPRPTKMPDSEIEIVSWRTIDPAVTASSKTRPMNLPEASLKRKRTDDSATGVTHLRGGSATLGEVTNRFPKLLDPEVVSPKRMRISNPVSSKSQKSMMTINPEGTEANTSRCANPLDTFFKNRGSFVYDPSRPAWEEFNRLADHMGWVKKERPYWKDIFKGVLVQAFNLIYGTDGDDPAAWVPLCQVLRINPVPPTLHGRRRV